MNVGRKIGGHSLGYPIGKTALTIGEARPIEKVVTVFASSSLKYRHTFYISFADHDNLYGHFSFCQEGQIEELRKRKTLEHIVTSHDTQFKYTSEAGRKLFVDALFQYGLAPRYQLECKMMQVIVELFRRTPVPMLRVYTAYHYPIVFVAGGFVMHHGSRMLLIGELEATRRGGNLFPIEYPRYSGRHTYLIKDSNHPDELFREEESSEGAFEAEDKAKEEIRRVPSRVDLRMDGVTCSWAEYIAQHKPILGGTGPVLPLIPYERFPTPDVA